MNEKYILAVVLILIVAIVFVVLILILKKSSKSVTITKETKTVKKEPAQHKKNLTIKDMTEIAAKRNSSEEELKKAIDYVKINIPFPKKDKYKLPKDIKIYLNFVLLIASHKNANAALIAYMDRELKKRNPQYTTEIDIYENEGLKERGNRI